MIQMIALALGAVVVGVGIVAIVWWVTGTWQWALAAIGFLVALTRTIVFRVVYEVGRHLIWKFDTLNRWHAALAPRKPLETLRRHPKDDRDPHEPYDF
jgi:hypothetical protein